MASTNDLLVRYAVTVGKFAEQLGALMDEGWEDLPQEVVDPVRALADQAADAGEVLLKYVPRPTG